MKRLYKISVDLDTEAKGYVGKGHAHFSIGQYADAIRLRGKLTLEVNGRRFSFYSEEMGQSRIRVVHATTSPCQRVWMLSTKSTGFLL